MKLDPGIRKLREAKAFPVISEQLGIARTAPYDWKRVPAKRVLAISRITGLSPHELRPDLYPKRLNGMMKAS
jgi:DNA-binding transcriptional regulator YdaS (Cro superfamily)